VNIPISDRGHGNDDKIKGVERPRFSMAMKAIVPKIRIVKKMNKNIFKRTPMGFIVFTLILPARNGYLPKADLIIDPSIIMK